MTRVTSCVGRLGVLAFLFLAGGAIAGAAVSAVPMPEPSFPLELIVTAAGSTGLVCWFRRKKTGPSQNR